ncbi:hypothetical protein C4578_02330 [Candidatus Microgenomates bacterium]|nr:MAG: hypothetical protein C4578_02330 [Candidatus Microgenomates bacterium]
MIFLVVMVAIVMITGCALRESALTPTPEIVKETVPVEVTRVVPQVVKETVVVEKEVPVEVTRVVEVLVTPTPGQEAVQSEPTVAMAPSPRVQAFGLTLTGGQTLDDIRVLGLEVMEDWPRSVDEFVILATRRQAQPSIEPSEVSRARGEPWSWKVPEEKDLFGNIVSIEVCNFTPFRQDGWMADRRQRELHGRTLEEGFPPEAVGSGIPAGWCGPVQGITFRPFSIDEYHRITGVIPVTSVGQIGQVSSLVQPTATLVAQVVPTQTPVPLAAPTPVVPSATPAFSPSQVNEAWIRSTFGLAPSVRLVDLGNGNWQAPPQDAFFIRNPFEFPFDGERLEVPTDPNLILIPSYPKARIPVGWEGMAIAATFWREQYLGLVK